MDLTNILHAARQFLLRVDHVTLSECLCLNKQFTHILQRDDFWQDRIVFDFGSEYVNLENMEISGIILLDKKTKCDLYWSLVDISGYDENLRRLIWSRALEIDSVPWYKLAGINGTNLGYKSYIYSHGGVNLLRYYFETIGNRLVPPRDPPYYDKHKLSYELGCRDPYVTISYAMLTCDNKIMKEVIDQYQKDMHEGLAKLDLHYHHYGLATSAYDGYPNTKSGYKAMFFNYVFSHYSQLEAKTRANFYEQYYPDLSEKEVICSLEKISNTANINALDYYLERYIHRLTDNSLINAPSPLLIDSLVKSPSLLDVIITSCLTYDVPYLVNIVKQVYKRGLGSGNKEISNLVESRLSEDELCGRFNIYLP